MRPPRSSSRALRGLFAHRVRADLPATVRWQTTHYGKGVAQRTCAADRTGYAMLHTPISTLRAQAQFYIEYFAVDLIMRRSRRGWLIDLATGTVHRFVCRPPYCHRRLRARLPRARRSHCTGDGGMLRAARRCGHGIRNSTRPASTARAADHRRSRGEGAITMPAASAGGAVRPNAGSGRGTWSAAP